MAYQRPGVYVEETLNAIAPIIGPSSTSVAAFIGANNRGPLEPTLVTSWSQYTNLYGSWNGNNKLPIALYMFFANGGGQAYVKRVVTTGTPVPADNAQSASITIKDENEINTLKLTASNPGAWGNKLYVTTVVNSTANTFDLIVFKDGTSAGNVVKRFTDLSMDPVSNRYAVSVINADSMYVIATDMESNSPITERNPVAVSASALAAGQDGAAPSDADIAADLESFEVVKNSLILNVPGVHATGAVNSIIAYAAGREDVFAVIDPSSDPVGTVTTLNSQLNLTSTYVDSSYAAVYYPEIVISDPTKTTPGTTKTVSPGGAIVAKYVTTDAARGVFKAPAGIGVRIAGAVSVPVLTNAELDALNTATKPVNAIKYVTGSGIVVMGSRTLKSGYADMYVPVRRTLIYLRKAMTDLTTFAVFEPNDARLWRTIEANLEGFLTNFWQDGGLRGATPSQAFFVKCDGETNPLSAIEAGEVNIEVGVALQRPAEFVIIKIGQFDGGTTVTVA